MTRVERTWQDGQPPPRLTRLIEQIRDPDEVLRKQAWEGLYIYAVQELRPVVGQKVHGIAAWIDVSEVFAEAAYETARHLREGRVPDTERYRGLFIRIACNRTVSRVREAVARRKALRAATSTAHNPHEVALFDSIDLFGRALAALQKWEEGQAPPPPSLPASQDRCEPADTPLSDAVCASFLSTVNPQFLDEQQPLTPEAFCPATLTFQEIGAMLKVSPSEANKRFWAGVDWLKSRYPDLLPLLPDKQKSGRKKGGKDEDKGGAA